MNFLKKLFKPKEGLVLLYDPITLEDQKVLEEQILETQKYYSFVPFLELINATKEKKQGGLAAIALKRARRSVFQWSIPFFEEKQIPFILYINPDCIGTNQLPWQEELRFYENKENLLSLSEWEDLWINKKKASHRIAIYKEKHGPLPLSEWNPLSFFSTWGKIIERKSALMTFGIEILSFDKKEFEVDFSFSARQLQIPEFSFAFCEKNRVNPQLFWDMPVKSVQTERAGVIDVGVDLFQLPRWVFP